MEKVLIIDDDNAHLKHFSTILESEFKIETSSNGTCAIKLFKATTYAAVIVNVHTPLINGFDFIDSIKDKNTELKSALFIINPETSNEIRMRALRSGVKDVICPKMSKEEIILRIKNHTCQKLLSTLHITKSYKNLEMNVQNLVVTQSDKRLELTLLEFKLLSFLMTHQKEVVSRCDLKEFAWPSMVVQDKTLNTHISNLRSKMNSDQIEIKSVKGEGFVLI